MDGGEAVDWLGSELGGGDFGSVDEGGAQWGVIPLSRRTLGSGSSSRSQRVSNGEGERRRGLWVRYALSQLGEVGEIVDVVDVRDLHWVRVPLSGGGVTTS